MGRECVEMRGGFADFVSVHLKKARAWSELGQFFEKSKGFDELPRWGQTTVKLALVPSGFTQKEVMPIVKLEELREVNGSTVVWRNAAFELFDFRLQGWLAFPWYETQPARVEAEMEKLETGYLNQIERWKDDPEICNFETKRLNLFRQWSDEIRRHKNGK